MYLKFHLVPKCYWSAKVRSWPNPAVRGNIAASQAKNPGGRNAPQPTQTYVGRYSQAQLPFKDKPLVSLIFAKDEWRGNSRASQGISMEKVVPVSAALSRTTVPLWRIATF